MTYVDSHHKTLQDYPRPSVAVDTALLTVDTQLRVLVARNRVGDRWRLPGTFLHEGERIADSVRRSLADKAGVTGVEPRQLAVFDTPGRDDRGWVLSIAHLAVVPRDQLKLDDRLARLVDAADPGRLVYDHADIVAHAVAELRRRYATAPDPEGLLPEPFPIRDLHRLHELIAGTELQRDTFRRAMLPGLVPTGELLRGARGKPAELFRRA